MYGLSPLRSSQGKGHPCVQQVMVLLWWKPVAQKAVNLKASWWLAQGTPEAARMYVSYVRDNVQRDL